MTKLSRAEQDAILVPVIVAYAREQGTPRIPVDEPASLRTLHSFRAALRLDDDKLDKIIADHPEGLAWSEGVARS